MKRLAQPLTWLQVSAALFATSLVLPALLDPQWGFGAEMFALGALGPLDGQVGWYGNPLLFVAWAMLGARVRSPDAPRSTINDGALVVVAVLGLVLAATSLVTLPGAYLTSPATHGIVRTLGPGLFVWLASHLAGIVAAILTTRTGAPPDRARA